MGTISITTPSDGDTIDASDVNNPLNTIVTAINGNLDSNNVSAGGLTPASLTSGTGTSWAWQSWTPTWANLTIGNATVVAKYIQHGKTVRFKVSVTLGTTTVVGTSPTFTLPVTSATVDIANGYIGQARLRDASGDVNPGAVLLGTTTTAGLIAYDANSTFPRESGITVSSPFTWTSTDTIQAIGAYEAA